MEVLKRFYRIQIEYHYGYKDLCQKLKERGFKVNVTTPIYNMNVLVEQKDMDVGYIFATKIEIS